MCRVWFCSACGQSLPDGLRCMSLFGAWLLILVGAATTIAMAIQQGSYYLLLIAFAVSALGYIFTYGGIRVEERFKRCSIQRDARSNPPWYRDRKCSILALGILLHADRKQCFRFAKPSIMPPMLPMPPCQGNLLG
nr:PREDICTED: uncharacterized protein LOC109030035 isoform X3 [Bemisia tabaci]